MAKPTPAHPHPGHNLYNPLAPQSPHELERQANKTVREVYKPAFKQLGRESKRTLSMAEKRKSDNHYYLDWLNSKTQERQAHETAANTALQTTAAQAQQEVASDYNSLHEHLLTTGESTPGVVSNPGDANAFDVSAQAARDEGLTAATRQSTNDEIATQQSAGDIGAAANFAFVAANEARSQAQKYQEMSKLGDDKQQLQLTKAAEANKEVARLFDREISKAQIRGQLKASEAESALTAAKFGLDSKKFNLELGKFNFEEGKFNKKLGLEEREANDEKTYHEGEIELGKAKTGADKQKASYKITGVIQENISTIAAKPKIQHLIENGNTDAAKTALAKIYGSYTAADAAVELFSTGKLSPTTKSSLTAIGYIVPPKWR